MASLNKEEKKQIKDDGSELVSVVKKKVKEFESFIGDWHKSAKEEFDMVAGDQWSDEDKAALEAQDRVPVVFNRIAAFIRGVCGMEVSNRQAVKYLPREMGDVQPNEIMNAAATWCRDYCNAEDEESDAFRDMVICGIGCTETRLDYEEDQEGMIFVERRDPLRVGWDTTAVKRNLTDANWVYSFADYSKAAFETKWPGVDLEQSSGMWPNDSGKGIDNADNEEFYKENDGASTKPQNSIRVVQFQYFKTIKMFKVQDLNGQIQEIPADKFNKMKKFVEERGMQYVKYDKREYRQCFVAGDVLLDDIKLPANEFTLKFLTGIRDRNKGHFYGMVRDAIDPQKWSNKFFSLAIEILATNSKGGLLAETDAFEDRDKAEEDWANPRAIVWARPGTIRDGKITQRQSAAPPPALDAMMGFAVSSMPQIMGINMEFLGLADRAQAGVLESQRKQAAISTLAEFFAALSLYRRVQGKCLMTMILQYLADGRLIRIVGQEKAQYIPLLRQPGFEKFDVIVDEAPNSPDVKARTWDALGQILPQMMKMGAPIPPEVLDYSPIPASLAAKWKEELAKAKQQKLPPQVQQQMQKMQEQLQKLTQENQSLKSNQQVKMAEMQANHQIKMQELQAEREAMVAKLQLQREESEAQLELKRQIAEVEAQMDYEKMQTEANLKREQAIVDTQMSLDKMNSEQELKHKEKEEHPEEIEFKSKISELMTKVDQILDGEDKEPEPKDIKLNYNGTLVDAVLIKDDGSEVRVSVGRNKK